MDIDGTPVRSAGAGVGGFITIRSKPQRVHIEVQAVDSLVVGGNGNSVFIVSIFSAK